MSLMRKKPAFARSKFKTFYALSIAWQLGFLIMIPIGSFLFFGFVIDGLLGSQPLFLLIGLLVGIAVAIYGVYCLLAPLLENGRKKNA
jgi:F0F1-type ATP synthase assembly protein I